MNGLPTLAYTVCSLLFLGYNFPSATREAAAAGNEIGLLVQLLLFNGEDHLQGEDERNP